jgi:hypothetical protein
VFTFELPEIFDEFPHKVSMEVLGIDNSTTTFEDNILTFTGIEDSVTYEIKFVLTDFLGLTNTIPWEF